MTGRLSFFSAVTALVVAALLTSCMIPPQPSGGSFSPRSATRVPHVVGLSLGQAQQVLRNYRLTSGTVEYAPSSYPAGTVISQIPARRARVYTGTAVNLTVSSGSHQEVIVVPSLTGVPYEAAVSTLQSTGLVLGTTTRRITSAYADGTIISQSPPAGRSVYAGSKVNLVIAQAPAARFVTVPNVVGLTLSVAESTLSTMGLRTSVSYSKFAHAPVNQVVSQDPGYGTRVPYNSTVTVYVSRGAHRRFVTVPNVQGRTLASARTLLGSAGLEVGTVSYRDGAPYGLVRDQSPNAHSRVRPGTRVNLVLGRKAQPSLARVPNLAGLSATDAKTALSRTGLVLGAVTRQTTTDPRVRPESVLAQSPSAGRYVPRGTTVNITVAVKSDTPAVTVPNIVGMSLAEAKARLAAFRLSIGSVSYQVSSQAQAGRVLSQNPASGKRVVSGTRVSLVLGKAADTPPDVVRVPGVLFHSEKEARSILEKAGLRVGTVKRVPGLPRNRVVAQLPLPGVRVKRGSKVNLHVSR
jgi:beta-lactam-binding protein with PASTA domain